MVSSWTFRTGEVCDLLGSVHYTQLGQYATGHFVDPRVQEPLRQFQRRLADVGVQISNRNAARKRPYRALLPAGIPQSMNIQATVNPPLRCFENRCGIFLILVDCVFVRTARSPCEDS